MNAQLYEPRPVRVKANERGWPLAVEGVTIATVREEWIVEDRWWSERPIDRHYFELTLADGRCEVVFREREHWFSQRA